MAELVKVVVFVPTGHADQVRKVIGDSGAGVIGNYSHCSFSSKGIGRFIPRKGANPTIGEVGELEKVEEERIETVCPKEKAKEVIKAIRKVHPYEEPVFEISALISEKDL